METIEENRVHFHLGMGDLDGDVAAVPEICPAKNRGHSAAGGNAVNAVVIELVAGVDWNPRECGPGRGPAASPALGKPIGSPAVHAYAFNAANADQMQADIITTVSLVGNIHQPACRR